MASAGFGAGRREAPSGLICGFGVAVDSCPLIQDERSVSERCELPTKLLWRFCARIGAGAAEEGAASTVNRLLSEATKAERSGVLRGRATSRRERTTIS